jgi:hypothetical protein
MQRRSLIALAGALAATLALGACGYQPAPGIGGGAVHSDTAPGILRAAPVHSSTVPVPVAALADRAGFNPGSGILWMNDTDRRRELDAMAATGARWIALDFDWNSIQGDGPTSFRWDRSTDTVVREARARGLQIVATLAYSPPWARRAACAGTSHCLPADPAAFARFARAAVTRYGVNSSVNSFRGSVEVWQIWNEANHYPFVQPTVDVPGYTAMLRQAYLAIKAADAHSTVLAGATSPAGDDPSGRDVAPVTFLRGIYASGGGGYFDAFSHHPYTYPDSPLVDAPWNAFTQTARLHQVLVDHGDGAKKIWGTESGAGTGTGPKSVSADRQAQLLHDYYAGWNSWYRSFTGPLLWFTVRDASSNPTIVTDNFGILRRNFQVKPARAALIAVLSGH